MYDFPMYINRRDIDLYKKKEIFYRVYYDKVLVKIAQPFIISSTRVPIFPVWSSPQLGIHLCQVNSPFPFCLLLQCCLGVTSSTLQSKVMHNYFIFAIFEA